MTDSLHTEHELTRLARLARARDEDLAGYERRPAARALRMSLVAGHQQAADPAPPRPDRTPRARRLTLAAAVGAVTAAVVLGPSLVDGGTGAATSYANSAIDVRREGHLLVARIKDPLADSARYAEAFQAVGKDVEIQLVPVEPTHVGRLLRAISQGPGTSEGSTEVVPSGPDPAACQAQPATCTLVLRVSADTTGATTYVIGRAPRPGEALVDPRAVAGPSTSGGEGATSGGGG